MYFGGGTLLPNLFLNVFVLEGKAGSRSNNVIRREPMVFLFSIIANVKEIIFDMIHLGKMNIFQGDENWSELTEIYT